MKKLSVAFLLYALAFGAYAQNPSEIYQELNTAFEKQDYEACLKLEQKALPLLANQDTTSATINSIFGEAHLASGNFDRALPYFEKEEKLRTTLNQKETDAYSIVLYNLANTYLELGILTKAGIYAQRLIENDMKLYPLDSEDFISSLLSVVEIYTYVDKFKEAESLLQKAIRNQQKDSFYEGVLYAKLGDLYSLTSQFSKGSKALNKALEILEKSAGRNSNNYKSAMDALGILYMGQGKMTEAEEIFDAIVTETTPGDDGYSAVLNNLAIVYQNLGQLEKAEKLFLDILQIDSVALGTIHPDYAISLTNLGLVYTDAGKFAKAERVLKRALEIQTMHDKKKTASYARKLNNLARVYRISGVPEKAIPLHQEALDIFKKTVGNKSTEFATTSFNLGMAYWKAGKGSTGIKHLKTSASIRAERLGKKHPKYAESIQKIAEYQWEQKQMKDARVSFNEVFENYYFQIDKNFPVLTEDEKAKFYYTNIKPSFEKFNAFAMQIKETDPLIIGEVYNHQINTKAAIMYATEKVKEAIQKSNDTTLIRQFEVWQSQKERIAKLYSQNQSGNKIDSLQQSADRLERELTRRSSVFASQINRPKLSWQEVQKKLQAGDAAVEIIRFKDYSPNAGGNFSDAVKYAFLIITPQTTSSPEVIMVENGQEMEKKFLNFYRNNIKYTLDDTRSYQSYFAKLAEALRTRGVKRVFLSPDGVYNQINLNTVFNPENKQYVIDEFEIRLVTNTRELLEQRVTKSNSQSTLLIGFPKFNLNADNESKDAQVTRSLSTTRALTRSLRGGLLRQLRGDAGISVLPGTEIEINQISKITPDPEVFIEANAAEGLMKQVISPMILHVATHGYFLDDEIDEKSLESLSTFVPSPLLKSGLLLAGSENFLRDGIPVNDEGDDGILTAYEAMNLKLEDTELVVLSACETGLGVVKNGEGVYGLQRAFKMAGAKSMVMSLWQVDDAATQQLMSTFYEEKAKTTDVHNAFRTAQQKLKEKYPHPFYWGAFILVGI